MLCLSLPKACFLLTSGLEAVEVVSGSMAVLGFLDFVTGADTVLHKEGIEIGQLKHKCKDC